MVSLARTVADEGKRWAGTMNTAETADSGTIAGEEVEIILLIPLIAIMIDSS